MTRINNERLTSSLRITKLRLTEINQEPKLVGASKSDTQSFKSYQRWGIRRVSIQGDFCLWYLVVKVKIVEPSWCRWAYTPVGNRTGKPVRSAKVVQQVRRALPLPPPPPSRCDMDILAVACALVATALYFNTLYAGFVYDDRWVQLIYERDDDFSSKALEDYRSSSLKCEPLGF